MSGSKPEGPRGTPEERLLWAIFGVPVDRQIPAAAEPPGAASAGDVLAEIEAILARLPERERDVLVRRLGLRGRPPMTRAAIALDLQITPEDVDRATEDGLRRWRRLEHDNDHP